MNWRNMLLVVIVWYALGILSISTTKILLGFSSPLALTFQQFVCGASILRLVLLCTTRLGLSTFTLQELPSRWPTHLRRTAVCFALGFLATNYGFSGTAVSMVETVKAAEPITSAIVAVSFGIDTLTCVELLSLGTIVAGVLHSTLQQKAGQAQRDAGEDGGNGSSTHYNDSAVLLSCGIVLCANLCFSFRGLNQKLYRQQKSPEPLDDINLQFRAQSMGATIFLFPFLISQVVPTSFSSPVQRMMDVDDIARYIGISAVNACAFTFYNLASTYVLTQLSVVHHATLNCLRRVVAIVVTSLLFGIPLRGLPGILLAVIGFLSYTRSKRRRKAQVKADNSTERIEPEQSVTTQLSKNMMVVA